MLASAICKFLSQMSFGDLEVCAAMQVYNLHFCCLGQFVIIKLGKEEMARERD